MPDEYVTKAELERFKVAVVKALKRNASLISDAFVKIGDVEDHENQLVDEALERATRAQRAVRRIERRMKVIEENQPDVDG